MTESLCKGKRFELECAHALTYITKAKFNRVPCSGAFATAQHVDDPRFKGDLFSEDPRFLEWCIECKIINAKFYLSSLFSAKSTMWGFWRQTQDESKGKIPILIFKYSHSPVFVMTPSEEVVNMLCAGGDKIVHFIDTDTKSVLHMGLLPKPPEVETCENAETAVIPQ